MAPRSAPVAAQPFSGGRFVPTVPRFLQIGRSSNSFDYRSVWQPPLCGRGRRITHSFAGPAMPGKGSRQKHSAFPLCGGGYRHTERERQPVYVYDCRMVETPKVRFAEEEFRNCRGLAHLLRFRFRLVGLPGQTYVANSQHPALKEAPASMESHHLPPFGHVFSSPVSPTHTSDEVQKRCREIRPFRPHPDLFRES